MVTMKFVDEKDNFVKVIEAKDAQTCKALWKDFNGKDLSEYEEKLIQEHNNKNVA